jgi:hypothetical protein
MRYAIYRCLYGEDFIQESIYSISPYFDKIFVFWDDRPWGDVTGVNYKGEWIEFPKKFDNILDKIRKLNNPKIELIHDHQFNNFNQFTHFVNDLILPNYQRPNTIMFIEVDHVFRKDQIEASINEFESGQNIYATTRHIELWRRLNYQIPQRGRLATVFWNMDLTDKVPETMRHANIKGHRPILNTFVHNLGFSVSEQTMYWKHLIALAMADKIQDGKPSENWYEEKWLKWDPTTNNKNLGMTIGLESKISHAFEYDPNLLPETLRYENFHV